MGRLVPRWPVPPCPPSQLGRLSMDFPTRLRHGGDRGPSPPSTPPSSASECLFPKNLCIEEYSMLNSVPLMPWPESRKLDTDPRVRVSLSLACPKQDVHSALASSAISERKVYERGQQGPTSLQSNSLKMSCGKEIIEIRSEREGYITVKKKKKGVCKLDS